MLESTLVSTPAPGLTLLSEGRLLVEPADADGQLTLLSDDRLGHSLDELRLGPEALLAPELELGLSEGMLVIGDDAEPPLLTGGVVIPGLLAPGDGSGMTTSCAFTAPSAARPKTAAPHAIRLASFMVSPV